MTRQEMLDKAKLTSPQFDDLAKKFKTFYSSLDPDQKSAVDRVIPSLSETAQSFGKHIDRKQLEKILGDAVCEEPFASQNTFGLSGTP